MTMPEQEPITLQPGSRRTVAEAQEMCEAGFPTVMDGDNLARHRGDMHRLVQLVKEV